ncbi:trypsin-like peptidase domain-containing protein [Pseudogemmobacter sonorensis]|uniref:S1C family serine protease n=1 Tax=Pseudogemmobacter sonorensis TaxID=2989681 RepID=UPI0036B26DFB
MLSHLGFMLLMASCLMFAALRPARAAPGIEAAMDSVLVIRSGDSADDFLGSGFYWGEEASVVVTNAHVVGDRDSVRLVDRNGREMLGHVIGLDKLRDVAVISLPAPVEGESRRGLVPRAEPVELGLEVYALGAPLGIEFTLTLGLVSATERQVDISVPILMVQHDAAVNPGSSGGPLVDAEGRLVGMNSQIADGSRMFVGIAYAIAAADVTRLVEGLIDETVEPFPALGLKARPVDRKLATILDVAVQGLLVDAVDPGSLAARAGLAPGDIILAADGVALAQPGAFVFAIEAALPAGELALTVARAGESLDLTLRFDPPEAGETGQGIRVRDLSGLAAEAEKVASYRLGALGVVLGEDGAILAVTENSPALIAGLVKGERIVAVDSVAMDREMLEMVEIAGAALLLVQSPGGQTRHVLLDPWGKAGQLRPAGGSNVLDPAVVVF